jgi:hypothetical protein
LVWAALAAGAAFAWWSSTQLFDSWLVMLCWQIVVVLPGVALAGWPLYNRIHRDDDTLPGVAHAPDIAASLPA